jgi:hypothetical protein
MGKRGWHLQRSFEVSNTTFHYISTRRWDDWNPDPEWLQQASDVLTVLLERVGLETSWGFLPKVETIPYMVHGKVFFSEHPGPIGQATSQLRGQYSTRTLPERQCAVEGCSSHLAGGGLGPISATWS